MQKIQFEKLTVSNIKEIIPFGKLLNPDKLNEEIENSLQEMFQFNNYPRKAVYDTIRKITLTV